MTKPEQPMSIEALANLAHDALDDVKAVDLQVLDVEALTPLVSRMLLCTGTSARHVRSLADNVVKQAKQAGQRVRGVEGLAQSEWVLVDLGDVVVHIMQVQTRALYQLEKLWAQAPSPAPHPSC